MNDIVRLVLFFCLWSVVAARGEDDLIKKHSAAANFANKWLVELDSELYINAWNQTVPEFKKNENFELWSTGIRAIRFAGLQVESRNEVCSVKQDSLENYPESGVFVNSQFETVTSDYQKWTEVVVTVKTGIQWMVIGYSFWKD